MGYTTDFWGKFELNTPLDADTYFFLKRFSETRRVKFNEATLRKEFGGNYGVDGEFFVGHHEDFSKRTDGQVDRDFPGLIDHNQPPGNQPSLWCQWIPTPNGKYVEWDGGEKFYCYYEWLQYIINNFLMPKNYKLSGEVEFQGEDVYDRGIIRVNDNARGIIRVNDNATELVYIDDELARLRKENEELKSQLADKILLKERYFED